MFSNPNISSLTESQRSAGVEMNFNSSLHGVIIFLITTFGGYLQFQYQTREKSLLEEHKNIMVAIYVNLFMYGMGSMAELKLKTCCGSKCLSIIKRIIPLFGILVVVLILILLYPVLGFVALIVWALITIEAVMKLLLEIIQWLHPIFIRAKETVTSYFNGVGNRSSGNQENGSADIETNEVFTENELPV